MRLYHVPQGLPDQALAKASIGMPRGVIKFSLGLAGGRVVTQFEIRSGRVGISH